MVEQQKALKEIVSFLPGWRVERLYPQNDASDERYKAIDERGRAFSIHEIWNKKDRWEFLVVWPMMLNGASQTPYREEDRPSCTVAKSRGPKAIATDLQRRFLPDLIEAWDKQKAQADENDAYKLATENLYQELYSILYPGRECKIHSGRDLITSDYEVNVNEVRIVGKDRVTIKVELTGDEAKEFLRKQVAKFRT